MAVNIKFTTNTKQVQRNIKRFQNKFPNIIQKGLKQAGFQLLEFIRTKTKKGLRFDSGRFASYSASYLKRLEKEGRPTAVDLIYDNRMMGSLTPNTTVKKTGKFKVSLGFSNAEMRKRALFNQVLNKPERPFFGFNDRTEKAIKKSFNRFVEKEIKRHL
tara:strand:- start:7178 stop:7654 length:477 start_codon:yes stop_codon:yes gene_type:complete